jgi:uridine kinase
MVRNLSKLVTYFEKASRETDKFIIAIDGPGGSGKSFFAEKLSRLLKDTEVVHFDDFYLPRYDPEIIGSNFDWCRLIEQVLVPLTDHKKCKYQVYNWITKELDGHKKLQDSKYLIVEGVTSGRLELRKYLNFIIFVETPFDIRLNRGIERDGIEIKDQWLNEWIPMEDKYFESSIHQTQSISDLVIDGAQSKM